MMKTKISIKDWDNMDKPREKLLAKSKEALSDAELLAIILGSGNREKSAVELAKEILNKSSKNINALAKLSVKDLMNFKGIGEAKAISIIAALELGRRKVESIVLENKKISSSKDVFEYLLPVLDDKPYEEFWIVLLSQSNKILSRELISSGGLTGASADPRKIFKIALDKLAASIILAHNHPSGNLQASESDIAITQKISNAGKLLDIKVLDHLIIGDSKYYSFADDGKLNF
ncbi:MAG: hypothetical protein AUJ98_01935 [Bacteroidetes bacterium CG2_30_33_31]|nr:MAG: hypothetical protein AUJ98_01935 [Bacteroidetes bacterium CG2_30_33_31]